MLIWVCISVVTALLQLALGTSVQFVMLSLAIFLLLPLPLRLFWIDDNVGVFLTAVTVGKLFIVSQWIKIILGQPADTHLAEPTETALTLLLGLLAFTVAAALLSQTLPSLRLRVLKPSDDPGFLGRFGWFTFALSCLGFLVHRWLTQGLEDVPAGRGLVFWNYLMLMMPMSTAALTARCLLRSSGRHRIDLPVILTILSCFLIGLLGNSRSFMLGGLLTFVITQVCYGARARYSHLLLLVAGSFVMQRYLFPIVDAQRSLPRDLSITEYFQRTFQIVIDIFDYTTWQNNYGHTLFDTYISFFTRLYYGDPFGFLDRFTPSQLDESVSFFADTEKLGAIYIFYPITRVIPNIIFKILEWEKPIFGGIILQSSIFPDSEYSNPNYGVFAELYAYSGNYGVFFAGAIFIFIFLMALHVLYGGFRNNYLAAFCTSSYLFVIADTDMGEMVGRTLEQGFVCALVYFTARLLFMHGGILAPAFDRTDLAPKPVTDRAPVQPDARR